MYPKNEVSIQCESLSKQYVLENKKIIRALDSVNLTFFKGSITGVVGKNGCGKTTLLKILSGIIKPSSGKALIYGKMLSILEIGTGFHHELSGRENIFLVARQFGLDKNATKMLLPDIVEFSEIGDFLDVAVKFYSQGMYLRLAISTIFALNADIYLFDEVIAVGDVAFQQKCIRKIRSLHEKGVSIIIVSHSYNDIQRLCDRCIVLSQGHIIADGSPLLVKEAFEESVYPKQKQAEFTEAKIEFIHPGYLTIENFKVVATGKLEGEKLFTEDQIEFIIEWTKISPEYGVVFHLNFLTEDEYPFLCTSNSFAKNEAGLQELRIIPEGKCSDKLMVPRNFFNSGMLKVHLSATVYAGMTEYFAVAQTTTPMIIKINEQESDLYFSKVIAPLRTSMNWVQAFV